jgi:dipeptidyl aminopeptidase/acylaminoacyl peptidase
MRIGMDRRAVLAGAGASVAAGLLPLRADAAEKAISSAPAPEMWAKAPALEHVALSDDGTHVAYVKEADGQKTIYDVDLQALKVRSILIGKAKVGGLQWLDGTHLMLTTFATDKEEVFAGGRSTFAIQTVYNLDKMSINTLLTQVENFKSFVVGDTYRIRKNGVTQVTASSYPVNFDETKVLFRFDLDNPTKYDVMDRGPWDTENWVLTPEGDMVARSVYHRKRRVWSLEYRAGDAWKEIFQKSADLESPAVWGLARDGRSLIVSLPAAEEGDSGNYYEMSPDGRLSAPLLASGLNAEPLFDPETFRHAGFSHYDGWSHPVYFDPASQTIQTRAQAAVEGYRMSIVGRARDPNKVIVYTEGDDDAGSYYFIDFATGKTITIGSKYPQIPTEWIAAKTAIRYKAADGLDIEAYLTLPPGKSAKSLPLVVLPHGGPQARDGLEVDTEAQAYASLGYAVLQPNFRGSSGYGLKFVKAGYGEWGRKMQTDLSDGVRELVRQGMVDPARVCIVGASYGGYAALAGATLDTGIYKCAVDVAGISDCRALLDSERPAGAEETEPASYRYLKRFLGDPSRLDEISPIRHVDKVSIPILIVHGRDDTVVPFSQSGNMAAALKAAGKDVTFIPYDHEDHWETNEAARTDMMKTISAFIQKHNPV